MIEELLVRVPVALALGALVLLLVAFVRVLVGMGRPVAVRVPDHQAAQPGQLSQTTQAINPAEAGSHADFSESLTEHGVVMPGRC